MTTSPEPAPEAVRLDPEAARTRPLAAEPKAVSGKSPADPPDPTRYGDWEKNGRCIDF